MNFKYIFIISTLNTLDKGVLKIKAENQKKYSFINVDA